MTALIQTFAGLLIPLALAILIYATDLIHYKYHQITILLFIFGILCLVMGTALLFKAISDSKIEDAQNEEERIKIDLIAKHLGITCEQIEMKRPIKKEHLIKSTIRQMKLRMGL